jgi:uncharacterized protein
MRNDLKSILSKTDYEAVVEFKKKLTGNLGDSLMELKVFGSKVNKQDSIYSDLDIIIILNQVDNQHKDIVFDAAVDVNLKYDVVISPIVYSYAEYNNDLFKETCFYKATQNEGIKL